MCVCVCVCACVHVCVSIIKAQTVRQANLVKMLGTNMACCFSFCLIDVGVHVCVREREGRGVTVSLKLSTDLACTVIAE